MYKAIHHQSRLASARAKIRREMANPNAPQFQFRIRCPGDLSFDVAAATGADAVRLVKKKYSKRVYSVELIREVKPQSLGIFA